MTTAKQRGKVLVNFEATIEQRETIRRYAKLHGLAMADYARMRALCPIEVEE